MILTSLANVQLRPVLPSLWSKYLMIARVHKNIGNDKEISSYIIACYWPPDEVKKHVPIVRATVAILRNKSPGTSIILGGDLNTIRQDMLTLEDQLNLLVPQAQDEEFPTHHLTAKNRD